jgi:energy-coupling factor transporter ATP-binding protein EcfA2
MLFSNSSDLINLKSDGNKLNICLGDALYESLSGGEKRKVDIALTIVQRDMLIDIAGVTSNIIVLDEVIDFCDETATESILSMFTSVSDTVSTMEIISHNDYNIPFDKTLIVHKTTDRQAIVEVV